MLKMMIAFFKGYFQYRKEVKKQHRWITKYAKQKNYAVNPNWMVSTNLKIWLSEMEATFGKRYCPCFEPSADPQLNKRMICPCDYIDDEIQEYGTCHCALFGPSDLDKEGWKASSARLMQEYRVPLNFKNGVLDTRGMPLDPRRNLPIPDVMHQLKSTLAGYSESKLKIIVQTEQEVSNIETIADYRGYGVWRDKKKDHIEVTLELDDAVGKGTNTSCGDVIQPDAFIKNGTGDIRLTQYSHGTGCECKIAPKQLESILRSARETIQYPELLVGNDTNDDAAAFDLGNGTSILSTTDFFMPIVDDPFTFGKIAACNAISDIYAMGGKPLMAISIFGWPVDKLSDEVAREVIEGGRAVCEEAGIPLAGGHSIDSPEPIFGLAVTGIVDNAHLKRNDSTEPGCELFITKPIGIGILTTAQKQGKIAPGDIDPAVEAMTTLNKVGAAISQLEGVTAVTDVTGFGLLGHLAEMCENSGIGAVVRYEDVPLLPKVHEYLAMDCVPGGTRRNFQSYGHKIGLMSAEQQVILCDSQTSGGLLCAVRKNVVDSFLELAASEGLSLKSIGETVERGDNLIDVI